MLVRPHAALQRGFTLIELMTTVTVLTIVLMIAVPSFRSFTANQKLRSASYALTSALLLARSQAIAQNGRVSLEQMEGADDWSQGWRVRDDGGANPDTKNTVASHGALPSVEVKVKPEDTESVTYGRDGRLIDVGADIEFKLTPKPEISQVPEYCVFISPSGLPSAAKGDAC